MAKRIITDAKIVLERAGYWVEYVYGKRNAVFALDVHNRIGEYICQLPVNDKCWIENDRIEELLNKSA